MRLLFIVFAVGCTDYEVSPVKERHQSNWFDSQSEELRSGMDADGEDTGEYADTGLWADDDEEGGHVEDGTPDDDGYTDDSHDDDEYDDGDEETHPDGDDDEDGSSSGDTSTGSTSSSSSGGVSIRHPWTGELVITEVMIHPESTDDAVGEWVEIRNITSDWLNINGHRLADRGVDDVEIEPVAAGSLTVAPGGHLILCAEADYWDNGGVECHGTFRYWTMGGGFALSNTEDEVQLRTPSGSILDEVRYGEGFSVEGEAMGLKPELLSSTANDSLSNWCEQDTFMPFGDVGTPGEANDRCW